MNSSIRIRNHFQPGDLGSIIQLHGLVYSREYGYNYEFEAYVAEPLSQFALRTHDREQIWIVESDSKVRGSIAICEYATEIAQLRWFLLDASLRGMGIGKKLIENALTFSLKKGYQQVDLWTVKGLDSARALYLANGFQITEEKSHDVWGSMHTEQKFSLKFS